MTTKKKDMSFYKMFLIIWLLVWLLVFLSIGIFSVNTNTEAKTSIDDNVVSCDMDRPYTCLDANFNDGDISIAMYGYHEDIMVEGCAHMTHDTYGDDRHVVDIYSFHCSIGDTHRKIFIDGYDVGEIQFSKNTGWYQ